jgi:hypothetical protein
MLGYRSRPAPHRAQQKPIAAGVHKCNGASVQTDRQTDIYQTFNCCCSLLPFPDIQQKYAGKIMFCRCTSVLWYPRSRVRSRPKPSDFFFGRKNPKHAFLRKGSKAVCPMSQICGMSKNLIIYCGSRKL